ncbi:MAG: hypothetical protein LBC93_02480 [Synergistaceae bacterium]|jgi:hypothetical protein|nr:hypothetical protein [Synergistaceae bacterium]
MPPRNDSSEGHTEIDRLIDTLRAIVGALNAHGLGGSDSIPVAIARIETRLGHLEEKISSMQKILVGLAVSVVSMVVKMLIEGVFRR